VFAWQDGSIGEKTADFFYPVSIVEKDVILEKCRQIQPKAVVTIASDLANITASYVARNLNLTSNSENSILISTNKFEMRKALKAANIPTPEFHKIGLNDDFSKLKNMRLPIIVKPTDRSGSRSITKLTDYEGLEEAIQSAINNSFEKKAIVEEYIDGDEYSFESISFNGAHRMLAITKKFTTGAPNFIETGHIQPSGLDAATVTKVRDFIFKALDALDIKYGASHAEFKLDENGNVNIIEIGSRMGGDCIGSDLVHMSTGYDFVKAVLDVSLGKEPSDDLDEHYGAAAIRFIFSKQDYDDYVRLKSEHPEVIYRQSDIRVPNAAVSDSSSRFGFYIVAGNSMEKAIELCKF